MSSIWAWLIVVRRAVFWTFSAQIVGFIIQLGTTVVMARLLSPKEVGVFAVAVAIMGIVQLLSAFSVGTYVIREQKLTEHTLSTAYTINAIISCTLALLIFASSFFSHYIFQDENVSQVLKYMALPPIIGIPGFRPNIMLQRAMQLRGIALVGLMTAMITSAVTIGAAMSGASSLSLAYGSIAGVAFGTLGTLMIGPEHVSLRMSTKEWRPITAFGLRLMSIGGISSAAIRVSDIILGHFLGLAALGLYSRASNLTNILFANVYGSATRVIFAKLSEAQRDGDRVTEVYLRGYRVIVAVMAPLLLGLAVLSKPAIHLLYGDRWMGAAIPLSLLLIGQLVSLTFAMNWELFVVRDDLKTQTRLELVRSLIGISTLTIASMFSLILVAATCIVDNLISFVLYQRHMPRLARTSPGTFYRAYGEAAILAGVAAVPPAGLMLLTGWNAATPMLLVFGAVGLGIALWLVTVVWMRHPIVKEINIVLSKITRDRFSFAQVA